MLLYHLLLQPRQIPDRWLSHVTAQATAKVISFWYKQPTSLFDEKDGTQILMNNKSIVFIAYSCDALELYLIYIGFLICIPTSKKRMIFFSLAGVLVIFTLNIIRCFLLTLLNFNKPDWFGFFHHYVFTICVYAFIFWAWFLYIRNYIKPQNSDV